MANRLVVSEPVRAALDAGRPVVALESTIISHGLPRPQNLAAALGFESILTDMGVTPATVAVLDGRLCVGLDEEGIRRIAEDPGVIKVSVRDLPVIVARGGCGATTVAATAFLAARAGLRVFATGGLGGVHRQASETYDESADLTTLSRTPITVVAAGVKSILDIPATLERLESLSVTVLGYRTDRFPAFWLTDSGYDLDWRVDGPEDVAAVMQANDELGRREAIVVANPLPLDEQLDPALHGRVLQEALSAATAAGMRGKAVTPFLLQHFVGATGGASLAGNLRIARNNVAVGGAVADAWARRTAAG